MITYRSQIWDALIEFIDKLKDFPHFEAMENGKIKKRIEYLYDRATTRMRFDKSDFDLLSRTFIYLNEKDIDSTFSEFMKENEKLGYKCITTRDGEKIIKECEEVVIVRKRDNEVRTKLEAAEAKFREAEAKREAYNAEHNRITDEFEAAKMELDMIKQAAEQLEEIENEPEEKKPEVLTNEEEIKEPGEVQDIVQDEIKETKEEVLQNEDSIPDEDGEEAEVIE